MALGVEKELNSVLESGRKELENKPTDRMIRSLIESVEGETEDIREVIGECGEELTRCLNFPLDVLEQQKKELLRGAL